jgi:hypothetical protein
MECFIIPTVIGAAEIVIKGLKISENSTRHSTDHPQKSAMLRTSHIMRKVLQTET